MPWVRRTWGPPERPGIVYGIRLGTAASNSTQNVFLRRNLVSDQAGQADLVATNLVNPWGLAFNATGPFWVQLITPGSRRSTTAPAASKHCGNIPSSPGSTNAAAPDRNGLQRHDQFPGHSPVPARFILPAEDGIIAGLDSEFQRGS